MLALPWSIYHNGGLGCLQLLQDGAILVRDFDDIIQCIDCSTLRGLCQVRHSMTTAAVVQPAVDRAAIADLTAQQRDLLALVAVEPTSLEQLAEFSTDSPSALLANLSTLELKGLIERVGGAYVRA